MNSIKLLIISCFFFFAGNVHSQKPPIDSSVCGSDKWPRIAEQLVSSDGNYFAYVIRNKPSNNQTLLLQATNLGWKMEKVGASNAVITANNRNALFRVNRDTLCIVTLGTSSNIYVPKVRSFQTPKMGTGEWVAYLLDNPTKQLVIKNLLTEAERVFESVKKYSFDNTGTGLVVQVEKNRNGTTVQSLIWINLSSNTVSAIWEGKSPGNFVFDKYNKQMVFTESDSLNKQQINSIWHYREGREVAELLCNAQSPGISRDLQLGNIKSFSKDGTKIFFNLQERVLSKPIAGEVKVDIWSYTDTKLQSQQLNELSPKNYTAIVNINDHRIIQLEKNNERILTSIEQGSVNRDDLLLLSDDHGNQDESNWNANAWSSYSLVSIGDGQRIPIRDSVKFLLQNNFELTPDGKYIIYYDFRRKNYFSINVKSGEARAITKNISAEWTLYKESDMPLVRCIAIGIAGWIKDESAVLIYDQNDIWLIDLTGNSRPLNITNGYGHKHNIVFRFSSIYQKNSIIERNEKILLNAFNLDDKKNGFFRKELSKNGDPELLIMDDYIYDLPSSPGILNKTRDATKYVVCRMKSSESRNYFITESFREFTQLTDVYPEKSYNWLTADLVKWKTIEGVPLQGVLYKPENFDKTKKYPLIIHYYDKVSDNLNAYAAAEASTGPIDIPWFVSNGYIVFTPDIHYEIGRLGESIFDCIVSAAKYLSTKSWIDRKRIGIQGHSFGGYETNFLITHTNIFAAASSSSGVSDLISNYGGLFPDGSSVQEYYELRRMRMGASLWERPNSFINSSPILKAEKITTPLLMMNNKNDFNVPFSQGVQFFTALRRLGKRAWMLQYDNGNHTVTGNSASDYQIRIMQFFDHYLKGAPAPKWMIEGIAAKEKGLDDGLELVKVKDKNGKWITPTEGVLLMASEKKKVHAMQTRKPITITLK